MRVGRRLRLGRTQPTDGLHRWRERSRYGAPAASVGARFGRRRRDRVPERSAHLLLDLVFAELVYRSACHMIVLEEPPPRLPNLATDRFHNESLVKQAGCLPVARELGRNRVAEPLVAGLQRWGTSSVSDT